MKLKDKKPFLFILSCQKNLVNCQTICETWLKNSPIEYRFIVGDKTQNEDFIDDGEYISVKCNDGYRGITRKLILSYFYIYENFNFDYLIRTDDDVYMCLDRLLDVELPEDVSYTGKFGNWRKRIGSEGWLTILSRDIMNNEFFSLFSDNETYSKFVDDIRMSVVMKDMGVEFHPFADDKCFKFLNRENHPSPNNGNIIMHNIKPQRMREIHSLFT